MRSCFSGAAFSMASPVETQQAFLEGHAHAFEWFDGVFGEVRYDNLGSAVKQVLKGRRRVETDRFIALRSHYLFESLFTTPGIEGAHEKGGVEGEVGRFRRNHLVPVPEVGSIAKLNLLLREACERDLSRQIQGRQVTIGDQLAVERPLLRALPVEGAFDASETDDGPRRRQGVGHGPPEPLQRPGRARRAARRRPHRRGRDHRQPPRPAGRAP